MLFLSDYEKYFCFTKTNRGKTTRMDSKNKKNIIDSAANTNHLAATANIVDIMKELIIKDERINLDTKKRYLSYYLQYQFHHKNLSREVKELAEILNNLRKM